MIIQHVENIIVRIKNTPLPEYSDSTHPTLFHEILRSKLLDSDKTVSRLKDEALIVVGAGTLTTSWALAVAIYYLISKPEILKNLKSEFDSRLPEPNKQVPLPKLEDLPYLTAVIQEALRLSYGVSSRLQRISPDKPMFYTEPTGKTWTIPKNVPVGMTSVLVHHDESIFPDSHTFRPERWIENPVLEKYLVSFSKGSRQCLGINLAYAEMYLCLSTIFRHYGSLVRGEDGSDKRVQSEWDEGVLELLTPERHEVEIAADGFIPLRCREAKGLSVRAQAPSLASNLDSSK
jgi:cytochrome P450